MHEHLASKIETIITSPDSNVHLRALLIEGINGTPLAKSLEDALNGVVFSDRYAFQSASMPCRRYCQPVTGYAGRA